MTSHSSFWFYHPSILYQSSLLTHFFPHPKNSIVENLNSIVRLSFYLAFFLILFKGSSSYLLLPFMTLVITYLLYFLYYDKKKLEQPLPVPENKEDFDVPHVYPTDNNPFMNFNYITGDYYQKPAPKIYLEDSPINNVLKKEVSDKFNEKLYRDVSDLYSKNNSQRQYFTMPWTSCSNNQTTFAKWLFNTGPTCKELGVKCAPYDDIMGNSYHLLQK